MTRPRVLIVDDEEDILLMLRLNLEMSGYEVVEARSGEQTLDLLAAGSFAAVIVDLRLPGMNGLELVQILNGDSQHPKPPVIMASAHASTEIEQQALAAGCYAYLTKPLSIAELKDILAEIVRRQA